VRLEHNEIAAASKASRGKSRSRTSEVSRLISMWGRPMTLRKNQAKALSGPPGHGLRHHRSDSQNNVGIVPVAAGAGSSLHRLHKRGEMPK
jgi:hypothetical protein